MSIADSNTRTSLLRQYRHPRYWLTWLGIALLWLIAQLPLRCQVWLGTGLGRLALRWMPKRRLIADVNLRLCFPELTASQHADLLRETFENNAIGYFEAASAWFTHTERYRSRTTVFGLRNLSAAQSRGKGVILLGGHFSTLDMGGSLFNLFSESGSMQRDHDNPLFNAVMSRSAKNFVSR
jgi:KDO2-lipid IV(A) lauroyltransferase